MKTRMFVLSLLALTIVSTAYTASARALEWTGTQILTTVSAERKLDADGKFGLRAHLFDMRCRQERCTWPLRTSAPPFR